MPPKRSRTRTPGPRTVADKSESVPISGTTTTKTILPPIPKKQKTLSDIQSEEKIAASKNLANAKTAIAVSVKENKLKDLAEATSAIQKLQQIPTSTPQENFFDNYNPETDLEIFQKLNEVESNQQKIRNELELEFEKKSKKQNDIIDFQTELSLEAIEKALKAGTFTTKTYEEINKIVYSSVYNTRAGQEKLKILTDKLIQNYQHHFRFLLGQKRVIKLIRKVHNLPHIDTEQNNTASTSQEATTQPQITEILDNPSCSQDQS